MIHSTLEIPYYRKESQTNRVTLLSRCFSGYQLKVSREENGRLRGWVSTGKTREVKLKGLPASLTFPRATQLLQQSYLKLQKEAIEVLPKGLGGGMKHSRPSPALESEKAEICKEEVLQQPIPSVSDIDSLVETISNEEKREKVRRAVAMLLKNDPKKKNLNLWPNQIGDAGAQILGGALKVNHTLQSLTLRYAHIGVTGAQALGTALQVNQSIQSLNLWNNQICTAGAKALGASLKVNQSIQTLNPGNNIIATKGAEAIGDALQINQSLQSLHLGNNQINATGAEALNVALQVNQSIQTLNLGNNVIGAEGIITVKRIQTRLEANKQIVTLFQQQITQVQSFLQSHENDDGILLEHLPQLKELLSKWYTDSNDLIPSLQEILRQSGKTNLNDRYKEKLEGIITNLTNRLYDLWLESFERKIAALSNEYVMSKESSEERNVDLGYALYDTWLAFVGSDYPSWLENRLESLIPFGVLLDIAEGGKKKDVTDLTNAHSLFERVLLLNNESKDSIFSVTNPSQKL